MSHADRLLGIAAVLAMSGCAGTKPSAPVRSSDDAEVVGAPVYQPMLVVGLPGLQPEASNGPVLESLTARNTPLGDVLLGMFKDSDINLLIDDSVQATSCTFDIKHATVEEAFESLLRSIDVGYEWDGSFLRIRPTVHETIYVDLLGSGGDDSSSSSTGGSGAAGATTRGDFWTEIQGMLPELVTTGKALVNEAGSSIHVDASPASIERLREVVDTTLRRRNAQVSIEARILEVRLDDHHSLGVNWALLPGLFHSTRTGLGSGGSIVSQAAASGGTALNFGVFDDNQYSVFVDALEKQGQVRVLSSPRVSTMNNVPANIRVADQIPVISREVITDQGVARSEYSVSFVEAGVIVQATPMIGEDGMITMRVTPEVTEQTGTVVTPDGLVEQPILSRRTAQAVVRVANGQAVVIGGLRKTRKDESLQGVPFLMDLPFLGQLFSNTVQSRQEVELMILVVPRVLDASWIEEESRRGAHRLVTLRRSFRWNSIGFDSFRPEDYTDGVLQGSPIAASSPEARLAQAPRGADVPDRGRSITRAGLAGRLLARAQSALDAGQLHQASVWLDQALVLDPQRVDALVTAGVLSEQQGLHERARQLLDRALAIAPNNVLALTARGSIELADGSPHSARRLLAAAHEQAHSAFSACNLGAALLLCGENDAARALLRAAIGGERLPELWANLTYADLAAGEIDLAQQDLQQALVAGADPGNPRVTALMRLVEQAAARK